jgi:aspartate aminotransferase
VKGGSVGLAEYLLNEAGVAVVPGKPFGDDDAIRISFARDVPTLEKGLNRVSAALKKLRS